MCICSDLENLTDDFPEDFFKMKVLPELLKSVEFGGGGPKAFGVVMKISTKLSNDDFESKVTPVVIRLFGNPDRAIRVCLLDSLPLMIDRLPQKVVNDKIFPQIVSAFLGLWYARGWLTYPIGNGLHRHSSRCTGANFKVRTYTHNQTVRQDHQRRSLKVSRKDGQR